MLGILLTVFYWLDKKRRQMWYSFPSKTKRRASGIMATMWWQCNVRLFTFFKDFFVRINDCLRFSTNSLTLTKAVLSKIAQQFPHKRLWRRTFLRGLSHSRLSSDVIVIYQRDFSNPYKSPRRYADRYSMCGVDTICFAKIDKALDSQCTHC